MLIIRLILAKIHMVTKLPESSLGIGYCLILAKIHMVTKHYQQNNVMLHCLILAKIHMVTKPQIHDTIYLISNKSLNISH